ncbi:hypothetical protein SLITO_v1c08380 [Spiroplasma litorale]|uniref:Uncharacterized protein n=1 Tax=Spiroplasma litorale TaxID=216942 RepID=A0A0K1W2Q3_9MOLU|nr:hypothetical protein [Spiroplasma litorale]AKX34453.1 hypothetical protein SLITO_v1c08380 [Spiroplasma litorale]
MKIDDKYNEIDLENEEHFLTTKKQKWKKFVDNYFKLNTKKITYLSLLLAVNVLLSFICFITLSKVAFLGFLRVELSFVTYIVIWKSVNSFYATIMIFLGTWIRFGWIDNDFVGLISLNISDLLAFWIYLLLNMLFSRFINHKKKVNFYLMNIASFSLCIVSVGLINVILNFTFLLPMYIYFLGYYSSTEYFLETLKLNWFLYGLIIFGFNALKYSINFIIYISIHETLDKIIFKL